MPFAHLLDLDPDLGVGCGSGCRRRAWRAESGWASGQAGGGMSIRRSQCVSHESGDHARTIYVAEVNPVTEERTQSYSRVVKALEDLGPSKLQSDEQAVIRDAADALIFCASGGLDEPAEQALRDVESLLDGLVLSGRWTEPTAQGLLGNIAACGPTHPVALLAA